MPEAQLDEWQVRPVAPAQVLALRQRVLRPGRALEEAVFAGDEEPDTLHLAALDSEAIIGVASIYRRPFPLDGAASTCEAWQLRGMAVAPERQGQGIGRALLSSCMEHAAHRGGTLLWCNARREAARFYGAAGFGTHGEEFEIPDVGPHFLMARQIESASST